MQAHADSMIFLYKNIAEIKKLGEVWGLNEDEINQCSSEVFVDRWTELWMTATTWLYRTTRKHWKYLVILMCPVLLLVLLNTPVLNVTFQMLPAEISAKFHYGIMSPYRKMVSPFLKFVDLTENYNAQCIVNNPLFEDPVTSDCHVCENIRQVKQFKNPLKQMMPFLFAYALVHRKLMPNNVTVDDVVSLIKKNRHAVGNRTRSNVAWIKTTLDMLVDDLEQKINKQRDFHLTWDSQNQLFDGQLMRKLFPRPKIFPPEVESSVVKVFKIDGPHSSEYQLPTGMPGEYCFYMQGKGTKTLLFTPLHHCQEKCYSFQVTMRHGDVLTFPVGGWHVKSLVNGPEISITYISQVSMTS